MVSTPLVKLNKIMPIRFRIDSTRLSFTSLLQVINWFSTWKCHYHRPSTSFRRIWWKNNGLIGTKRIKLRHQDILFYLKLGKGQNNPADYFRMHITQWKSVSKSEKNELKNLGKHLYTLHAIPVINALGIKDLLQTLLQILRKPKQIS